LNLLSSSIVIDKALRKQGGRDKYLHISYKKREISFSDSEKTKKAPEGAF
jgi:hypothetical protein